jgi:hypothetical protein
MAVVDSGSSASPPAVPHNSPNVPRGVILAAAVILLAFVGAQGRSLWREWQSLQGDLAVVRRSAVIGYKNIHPNPSYAVRPADWFHHEGDFTLLWSGWKHGNGHQWFRVGRGDVEQAHISLPLGRDVIQAIDYPLLETGGGTIWKRIPNDSQVVGIEIAGKKAAYPVLLLDKVRVVNDLIEDRPFLVTYDSLVPSEYSVRVFDPVFEGQRITMGVAGYYLDRKALLYDRGTESLWAENADGELTAVAGRRKGVKLRQIARPTVVSWGDWRWQHPEGRLLVGADRSKVMPSN